MLGFPLAVALGRGGCGEIIPGTAEWSRHQTHREKWITPTGRDSNKLEGWSGVGGVGGGGASPDKSTRRRSRATGGDKTGEEEESNIELASRK